MSDADKTYMQEAADAASAKLPDNHGFILFAFPFKGGPDSRLRYVANCERADAIRVLKTWLLSASGEEEWLKHIK